MDTYTPRNIILPKNGVEVKAEIDRNYLDGLITLQEYNGLLAMLNQQLERAGRSEEEEEEA